MRKTLYRASFELHAEGRTLIGVAMPWDTPAKVRDLSGPAYLEAFSPESFARSLEQRPEPRPVFVWHEEMYGPAEPIGVAHFEQSARALLYRAFLSRTRKADEQLELVKDGAMGDVSVGFRPVTHTTKQFNEGLAVYRTEVALRELSTAPTGYGQYPQAKTLAVRAMTGDEDTEPGVLAQAVDAAIDEAIEALEAGDTAQALALMHAADVTVDQLQAVLGVPDIDPTEDETGGRAEPPLVVVTATPKLDALRSYRRRRGF